MRLKILKYKVLYLKDLGALRKNQMYMFIDKEDERKYLSLQCPRVQSAKINAKRWCKVPYLKFWDAKCKIGVNGRVQYAKKPLKPYLLC